MRRKREETQRLKKGKETLEDSGMTKLGSSECSLLVIEDIWREAIDQLGRINALRSKLEFEYAEMSAELEASKLSASESMRNRAEVAKREKKSSKRI